MTTPKAVVDVIVAVLDAHEPGLTSATQTLIATDIAERLIRAALIVGAEALVVVDEEPPVGSVVKDAAGEQWHREASGWWLEGLHRSARPNIPGATWSNLRDGGFAPLTLVSIPALIEGNAT